MSNIYNSKDHSQANLVYQEDLASLTPDRVMKFIRHHHDYQYPRLQMLDDYYQGFNTSILDIDNRRADEGKADHRAVHSFGKYIADSVDLAILVGIEQTKPIQKGLLDSKFDKDKLLMLNDVKEAISIAQNYFPNKETYILLENDLPDIFNE